MQKKVTAKIDRREKRSSEKGAAIFIAMVVIAAFIFIAVSAIKTVTALSKESKRAALMREDSARAEYYISMAEATIKFDVREKYNIYQLAGKQIELQRGGTGSLPMFDPLTETNSKPLLDLEHSETGVDPSNATSLYGKASNWARIATSDSQMYIRNKLAEKNVVSPDGVEIVVFEESSRRGMTGISEPIYTFRYTLRAKAGEFAEIVREDVISLGPAILDDSPVIENCSDMNLTGSANPSNVNWGSTSVLNLEYVKSSNLTIYNQSGNVVYTRQVSIEPTAQTISYTTEPITISTVFVAEAVRGACQLQVPIPVSVIFNQNISYTVNGVQNVNIIEGENVRYDWQVQNATEGYTTSWITYGTDPTGQYNNNYSDSVVLPGPVSSTYSMLHVRDSRINNNAEQTAIVNINVCRLPRVQNFSATPLTVNEGGNANITFSWEVKYAAGIKIVRNSDNQVIYTSESLTGSWSMPQPSVTTEYRIEAFSVCGAPAASRNIIITVVQNPTCNTPVINSFTANPSSVIIGGNQNIQFNWNVIGQINTKTIDQGIGSINGNTHSIRQPNATTVYTLTVTGCSQTVQKSATVTVNSQPSSEVCAFDIESDNLCSITGNQCGPHRIAGNIEVNGNSYTFSQTHNPFGFFGQGYFENNSFRIIDAVERDITPASSWGYTPSGVPYWIRSASGAGNLYQNGVTINDTLPSGTVLPIKAVFTVGYGANAGGDSKTLDTETSPGGCNTSGGGSCSNSQETEYFCDQSSNGRFTVTTTATVSAIGNNQYDVTVPTPAVNYFQNYSSGTYIITTSAGAREYNWTAIPGRPNSLPLGTNETTVTVTSTSGVSVIGNYEHFVSTSGECTVGGSLSIFVGYSASSCDLGNRR